MRGQYYDIVIVLTWAREIHPGKLIDKQDLSISHCKGNRDSQNGMVGAMGGPRHSRVPLELAFDLELCTMINSYYHQLFSTTISAF